MRISDWSSDVCSSDLYDMLKVAAGFAKAHPQTFSMEVWGGATFDVCLRFQQEDPWQRLAKLRKAAPNILLQMLIRGCNGVGYAAYPDNLIEAFVEKSWETGVDIFRIFDSLNWMENITPCVEMVRSEEHTSELQSLMRISYAVFCLKKKNK